MVRFFNEGQGRKGAKRKSQNGRKSAGGQTAQQSPALPIGSKFTGSVNGTTADGNGVVRHESGLVFFVPGVWLDEQVEVRVTGFKGRFGFAQLENILTPSPQRVEPPCPYQGHSDNDCGGCPWQFVAYQAQLEAKQQRVEQALAKLANPTAVREIWPSELVFGYRNRAQLKTDGESLGYLAASTRRLVDVADCLILTDTNRQTLQALREQLPQPAWRPGRRRDLTTLDIDETVNADSVSVNSRLPFQQANSRQNDAMRRWLAGKLSGLDRSLPVLELFAGSGNFTEVIAAAGFTTITAVEVVEQAVVELQGKLPHITPVACDLFAHSAAQKIRLAAPDAAILVVDPPRDGIKNDTLKSEQGLFHRKSRLRQVFYISCNLATLVRDLEAFVSHGFVVQEVQPLDQFPHTPHIELLVHLTR